MSQKKDVTVSSQNALLWHSLITISGAIIVGGINFGFNILAGRLFPENFGLFGAVMSLFYIWTIMAMAIGMYGNRQYAQRATCSVHSYFFKFLRWGAWSLLFFLFSAPLLGLMNNVPWYYVSLLGGFALLSLPTNYLSGLVQAKKRFFEISVANIIGALAKLLLGIGLGWITGEVWAIFVGILLAQMIGSFCTWYVVRDESIWQGEKTGSPIDRTLWYTALVLGMQNILFSGDVLSAQRFLSEDVSSEVTALATFGKIVLWVAVSFSTVLFSYVVHQGEGDQHPRRQLALSLLMSSLLTAGVGLMLLIGGERLVEVVFGSDFTGIEEYFPYLILPLLAYNILHTTIQFTLTQPKLFHVGIIGLMSAVQGFVFWFNQNDLDIKMMYQIQSVIFTMGAVIFASMAFLRTTPKEKQEQPQVRMLLFREVEEAGS